MAKMPAGLIAGQGVLDVPADRRVDIAPCRLVIPEGGVLGVGVRVVKCCFTGPQRPAIADILVDAVDPQQPAVFPVGDKGRVDGLGPVVQLLIHGQPEAQRVGTGQDNLHPHGGKDIGEDGGGIDEVAHQRNLINEYVLESRVKQLFQIPVHHRHIVCPAGFEIGGPRKSLAGHPSDGLPEHGGFSRPAQAEDQADPVAPRAVQVILQLRKAVPPLPALYPLEHGGQPSAGNDTGFKVQLRLALFRHLSLQLF